MDKVKFNFSNSDVLEKDYNDYQKKLKNEVEALNQALLKEYDDIRASINLCDDVNIITDAQNLVSKLDDATSIVVVGIGGSNLGTIAIYEALKGRLYNQTQKKQVYFADTVDSFSINEICNLVKAKLKKGEKVIINAISKSGGTTETIANFEVLLNIISKYANYDYKDYVVITTGVDSKFENYAKSVKFNVLNLPDKVGGRYSVFSQVGIFPLVFLGIDVKELFKGAKDIRSLCLDKDINVNSAMKSAVSIFENNKKGKCIFNTFLFSTQLESIGKWYRQLLGESIGKEFDLEGNKINSGIVPTTAIGSTDLHSMAQLYLGGPNNTYHCVVNVKNKPDVVLGDSKELDNIVPHIQNKSLSNIMDAILEGTKGAFMKKNVPFCEVELEELNEYTIGSLLQMKMIEMMFLGALFGVNPFDQPNVEEYKVLTKKELIKN